MKIDQIAAKESGLSNSSTTNDKTEDDDWITKLYRRFRNPLEPDSDQSQLPEMSAFDMR